MTCGMGRWEPDARGRLREAAMELYAERGYEQTTVADIAERAGLTARTFFRHFADKREVLFAGSEALRRAAGRRARRRARRRPRRSTPSAAALDAVADAARRATATSPAGARRVIAANAELQERELIKLAALVAALADGAARAAASPSRRRASPPRPASPPSAWRSSGGSTEPGDRSLADTLRDSFDQLSTVIAGG